MTILAEGEGFESDTPCGCPGWTCMTILAEGEGFEPTMDFSIPVFKTGALSHSAIPPFYEANPSKADGILPYPG